MNCRSGTWMHTGRIELRVINRGLKILFIIYVFAIIYFDENKINKYNIHDPDARETIFNRIIFVIFFKTTNSQS
jgi:hypothetical protein